MSLLPEEKIEIQTLIRRSVEDLEDKLNKLGTLSDEKIIQILNGRLSEIGAREAAALLRAEMDDITKTALQQIGTTKEFMEQIHKKTAPMQLIQEYDQLNKRILDLQNQMKEMANNFHKHFTSKFVEAVSNQELNYLFHQSGVPLKSIADYMNIEITTAHDWVSGKVQDMQKRDRLKKFLVNVLEKRIKL